MERTSIYDAEGRICAVKYPIPSMPGLTGLVGYIYDAESQRVAKGTISSFSCDLTLNPNNNGVPINGFQKTAGYILGLGGETVSENDGGGAWVYANVYANGELIGTYTPGGVNFHLNDWLGTRRMDTDALGKPGPMYQSYPFGELVPGAPAITSPENFFTGKPRDQESDLDYFGARHYASSLGRFMSPDPSGLVFASFANPQSLNLYSYVQNNPLSFTDPTGLDCAYLNSSGEYDHMNQTISSGDCGKSGGYWVNGGLTNVNIDSKNNSITLTGTTNGSDTTTASFQIKTNVYVDSWLNTSLNQAGHMTLGLTGQQRVGQNPRSDADFISSAALFGLNHTVVPGSIQNESTSNGTPGQLRSFAVIPVTGMQAQMIQNSINQSTAAPPNYSLNPALGLDCATWVQQVLRDAGIQTGPMQPYPNDLMKQLSNTYTVFPGHQ